MAFALFGLFDGARYPPAPPELGSHVGWLLFGLVLLMLSFAWTRAESVRRAVLGLEDPRAWATLRIGFALCTIVCFVNLEPYWRLLWSDEGMFDLEYARDRMGRTALRGWTPEEGFFDLWAVACFLWNKPSFFYLHGSPDFVFWHMMALFAACALFGAGVLTRPMGVLAWLLMSSVYNRNSLYWEGTDTVYRCFWLILLFAKTGHAWSFDNWWRCRRLRKRGLLGEPGHPVYRLVPVWPKWLFMLQLAAIYICTGSVKTGSIWAKGDALYYALNMDHFYRFEGLTQQVSSVLATNVFRLMTWVTLWWERCFPIVLVGVVLRFGLRHRGEPWFEAQNVWWRRWPGRLALVAAWAVLYRIVWLSVPYCLAMVDDKPQDAGSALRKVHVIFAVVLPLLVAVWFALGRWPIRLFRGGRSLGPLSRRFPRLRIPEIAIEQETLRVLLFGRRVWLTLGVMFHGFLILFMNIGMFPFIMLMTYVGFVGGDECRRGAAWTIRLVRKTRLRRLAPPEADRLVMPAQDPAAMPPKGRRIPDGIVLALGAMLAWIIRGRVVRAEWVGDAVYAWFALVLVIALAFRLMRPRPREVTLARSGPALAGGATYRAIALFALVWHTSAVTVHLWPSFPVFSTWRSSARTVFGSWLAGSATGQSWEMFAPNPPRSNGFMKTVVVEHDDTMWDLRNNAFDYRPNPWIVNDRMRKMHRRMVGKGKWYLRYWTSFHCREWALQTGVVPREVRISELVTRIPPPEVVNVWQPRKHKGRKDPHTGAITGRPYDPRELTVREKSVQTHPCNKDGKVPLFMKERYGLPIEDEDREVAAREADALTRQFGSRRDQWEKRRDWGRWWSAEDPREGRSGPRKNDAEVEEAPDAELAPEKQRDGGEGDRD